jgi:hypothetical protein
MKASCSTQVVSLLQFTHTPCCVSSDATKYGQAIYQKQNKTTKNGSFHPCGRSVHRGSAHTCKDCRCTGHRLLSVCVGGLLEVHSQPVHKYSAVPCSPFLMDNAAGKHLILHRGNVQSSDNRRFSALFVVTFNGRHTNTTTRNVTAYDTTAIQYAVSVVEGEKADRR